MSHSNLRNADIPAVSLCFTWHEPPDCSSPRGWCSITPETHPDFRKYGFDYFIDCGGLGCGNYLDYGLPTIGCSRGPNGETIHAVAYYHVISALGTPSDIRLGYKWCATIAQAKEWIETAVRIFLCPVTRHEANEPPNNGTDANGHNSNNHNSTNGNSSPSSSPTPIHIGVRGQKR